MPRIGNSIRNLIFGISFKALGSIYNFIIRIIILRYLGSEYLGLNSLFYSILSVLSLSELGVGYVLTYNMYKPIAEKNDELVCALLNFYKKIYLLIGIVVLSIGLLLLPFLKIFIKGAYPVSLNPYLLYLIFLVGSSVSYFMFSYKEALLMALQREDLNSKIGLIVNNFFYIAQIIILLVFNNYLYYILILPITNVCLNLLRNIVSQKYFPQYLCKGKINNQQKKELFVGVGALFGHKLGATVLLSTDNIVISSILGLTAVGLYNNYFLIITTVVSFFHIFTNSIRAGIGDSLILESVEKNYHDMFNVMYLFVWVGGWAAICIMCLSQPFIGLFFGEENILTFTLVVLLSVYFFICRIGDVMYLYHDMAGLWTKDIPKPYVQSLFNLIVNIILIKIIGINGVVISTILALVIIDFPWACNILFKYYYKRSVWKFLLRIMFYIIITSFIGFVTYLLCSFLTDYNMKTIIIRLLICLIIPNLLFFLFTLKMDEKRNIYILFKRLFFKKSLKMQGL